MIPNSVMLRLSADVTGISFPLVPVPFDEVVWDTGGFFNPSNPGIIEAPDTFSQFKASFRLILDATGGAGSMFASVSLDGHDTLIATNAMRQISTTGTAKNSVLGMTPWTPIFIPPHLLACRINVSGLNGVDKILKNDQTYFLVQFKS